LRTLPDNIEDFSSAEKLSFEKDLLGFYLTSHPHMHTLMQIKSQVTHEIELLQDEKEGTVVRVGGIIETMRRIFTKKTGAEMAFIAIGNEKGISIECIVFPKVFEKYKSILLQDSVVVIEGKIDNKNDRPMIISEKIMMTKSFSD